LSSHRSRGLSLGSSTLRRNVTHHRYGFDPTATKERPQKFSREQSVAIAGCSRSMTVAWSECDSGVDAIALEATLREQWLPPLNRG